MYGIAGEPLAMDVALLGVREAPWLLVLTSGTHGIEGYCGSGCQIGLLRDPVFLDAVHLARIAVLFVHAVNPHGFSHGRRVNEDNVDLNRNFRDFGKPLPPNPDYAEVHPLLLPETWPPPPDNERRIAEYIAAHGERAFQAAVTSGQYAFPDGLFYGGDRPTWSNRDAADGAAPAWEPHASAWGGSTSTRASARAGTARRSTPATTCPPTLRGCVRGGAARSRRSTTDRRRRPTCQAS